QTLSVDKVGRSVTWSRAGTATELTLPPVLQFSTDGVTYSALGTMTRIDGGWQKTNLALPAAQAFWVRAVGTVPGGSGDGSITTVQSVLRAYVSDDVFANGFD